MITDMRRFNCRGNQDEGEYEDFWKIMAQVCRLWHSRVEIKLTQFPYSKQIIDTENGSGAHRRRHGGPDKETTNSVSYFPGITSIPHFATSVFKKLKWRTPTKKVN